MPRQEKLSTTIAPTSATLSPVHEFHDDQESRQSSYTQAPLINATLPPTRFCLAKFGFPDIQEQTLI
jgi:hypothetical protein